MPNVISKLAIFKNKLFTNCVSGPRLHRQIRQIKSIVIVSNAYLFYVLFAGLRLNLGLEELVLALVLALLVLTTTMMLIIVK